ncbi:release factor glutamine methyltransferase [Quadrisphaera granulorum]|uniref:Release factor glutamine methyltransferase n=1 Tax=Quadrisphaera granulorum TaxID=317664 RepID=A0A316AH94_9ACTN|nr:peptide chain release factor N(5)-glutamine methyltransferase [Quadrisphaera granulorum]PWJ56284.1 release factor glutamine methyltransferase [Quadrisphaera granulorum]SZE94918.1 release factor glutamine methyltransferase [Quadrisphaera granulorum]
MPELRVPEVAGARGGDLAAVLRATRQRLAAAGVPSPAADADLLAGHVLGLGLGELRAAALRGAALAPEQAGELAALVARREAREPLQHLLGTAPFRRLELLVGPGVFVPRPETETTAGLAVEAAAAVAATGRSPLVVDLCTGSAAIALAVADEVPTARVVAVELDPAARAWAQRNVQGHSQDGGAGDRVRLVAGDATSPEVIPDLDGDVDVVVSNPPYVPPGAVPREPEVRDHDPALALWGGGDDGLLVPRGVLARAAALLRPGGFVVVEHAEVQGAALRALLVAPTWVGATTHDDATGRPRATSARLAQPAAG